MNKPNRRRQAQRGSVQERVYQTLFDYNDPDAPWLTVKDIKKLTGLVNENINAKLVSLRDDGWVSHREEHNGDPIRPLEFKRHERDEPRIPPQSSSVAWEEPEAQPVVELDLTTHTVLNAGHIVRYHTAETLRNPTLGEHVYGVLAIIDYLYDRIPSAAILRYALYHDLPEYHTGDIPYTAKRIMPPQVCRYLIETEQEIMDRYDLRLSSLNKTERAVFKIADLLEMGYFAVRDIQMGNSLATPIYYEVQKAVTKLLNYIPTQMVSKVNGMLFTLQKEIEDV